MRLRGVAVVTGAGSGVGLNLARTLVQFGVRSVFCVDKNVNQAIETARNIRSQNFNAHGMRLDVTSESSVGTVFDEIRKASPTGRIDYVVNAAGSGPRRLANIADMSFDEYREMQDVHNIGSFLVLRKTLQIMKQQEVNGTHLFPAGCVHGDRSMSRGSIVMISSLAAKGAGQGVSGYVAAKHAVEGLVQAAALEYGRDHIRVNGVAPSYINSSYMHQRMQVKEGLKEHLIRELPLGRLVEPTEVSDAIIFLLSASSSYLNGVNLAIDGGLSNALGSLHYR